MEESTSPLDSGKFSYEVIAVSAGEAHTLALTGDGSVYSWGRGTFGRLGNGSESDNLYPIRLKFSKSSSNVGASDDKEIKIVEIAAGAYHSLALADDGSVWAWGYNSYGQIGSDGDNSLLPCLVEGFLESKFDKFGKLLPETKRTLKVSSVKAGGMFSVAIDEYGYLWMWGNYPHPNNEEPGPTRCSVPLPLWNFAGGTVVKVACGNEHVVALVSTNETFRGGDVSVYCWGCNSHGQLGLGDKDNRSSPKVIQSFESEPVYEIACGAYHTAVLTKKNEGNDTFGSECWTFGLGENGQLGHGTTRNSEFPKPVKELPKNTVFKSVDCGLFHTSVVSSDGYAWSWGMEKGLGLCPGASFTVNDPGDALYPLLIACNDVLYGTKFPEPVQITCGAAHTVIIADKGYKLWSWGRGQCGVLGNGSTTDHFTPALVMWPPKMKEIAENRENNGKNPLSAAMDEVLSLQTKLSTMEKYASMLHGSIFGKPFEVNDIPMSLQNSGTTFDMSREWEKMLDTLDEKKLLQLEMFYNNMLTGVKDKKMNKKIQRLIRDGLNAREHRSDPTTLNPVYQ